MRKVTRAEQEKMDCAYCLEAVKSGETPGRPSETTSWIKCPYDFCPYDLVGGEWDAENSPRV